MTDGDNLWDLATARLRSVGADDSDVAVAALVAEVVSVNPSIDDPDLIYTGQHITMPAAGTPALDEADIAAPEPPTPADRMHTIVHGDTLWDILESTYGYVDVALVDHVADYNAVHNPDDIPVGTVLLLPTLPGAAGTLDTPPTVGESDRGRSRSDPGDVDASRPRRRRHSGP